MKAIKKWFALPVAAMLLVGGFSACSQDDDLFEYDLGNDGVSTLAKRSMGRNGEAVLPPTPPKEEEDNPRRISLGSGDFYEVCIISIPLISNIGGLHYEERPVGIGGKVTLYWVEGKGSTPAHFDASVSFDGYDNLEGYVSHIGNPNSGGIVLVSVVAGPKEEGSGSATITVEVATNPDFDYEHAFD